MDNIFSFEDGLPDEITAANGSKLSISDRYKKDGSSALLWSFERGGSINIHTPIAFSRLDMRSLDKSLDTFAVWVCAEHPIDGQLSVSFYKDGRECCGFEMGLDFCGWRTAWVAYERDMYGTPCPQMDGLRMTAKTSGAGELWLDQLIVLTKVDARHHIRDRQLPFVNLDADSAANSHWMSLYRFDWLLRHAIASDNDAVGDTESRHVVERRFEQFLRTTFEKRSLRTLKELQADFEKLEGRTINAPCHRAVYPQANKEELTARTNAADFRASGILLLDTALFLIATQNELEKNTAEALFLRLTKQMLWEGFAQGSGLGTMHHMGYQMREYYYAMFLLRDSLKKAGLKKQIASAMSWFSGLGRVFREDESLRQESMDTLNTLSHGMMAAALLLDSDRDCDRALTAIGHWLSSCMLPAPGLRGPFKEDGCSFHHCNHYPAYSLGGMTGVAPLVYLLSGTAYRISAPAHAAIKKSLLTMRLYCNLYHWPVSLSARHPVGRGEYGSISTLSPFYYLSVAGNPVTGEVPDREVAGAYERLAQSWKGTFMPSLGVEPETTPSGHWSLNSGCIALHRRKEWLAAVRGHSRYIWANESYLSNNLYGRYMAHGNLQIMNRGNPINNEDSGYVQEGWDWNNWPGTTAIHLPMEQLRANVCNVDLLSGYEEMLISDESYCGGADLDGNGVFAMKLHEHPKYNGSHRAKKSWFFFEDTIVCLGSSIQGNSEYPTETTLFQTHIAAGDRITVGEVEVEELGYSAEIATKEPLLLSDDKGNGYLIPGGQTVKITRGKQQSKSQNLGEDTAGEFSKAWIDHGSSPKNAGYHYAILVDCGKTRLCKSAFAYTVTHCDNQRHVVRCGTETGYALFEACEIEENGDLLSTDTPCVVIISKKSEDCMKLAIADPDLRLYEGVE
ncbi:MAG: chondroitinase family polysaccharide lyase, partial [Angelakisella sp.]